jgi:hypothetical protein
MTDTRSQIRKEIDAAVLETLEDLPTLWERRASEFLAKDLGHVSECVAASIARCAAEMRFQWRWVRCDKELPARETGDDTSRLVLCYDGEAQWVGFVVYNDDEPPKWIIGHGGHINHGPITHWSPMHLPNPESAR